VSKQQTEDNSEIRSPKSEFRKAGAATGSLRASGFGILSDFGFRILSGIVCEFDRVKEVWQ